MLNNQERHVLLKEHDNSFRIYHIKFYLVSAISNFILQKGAIISASVVHIIMQKGGQSK